MCSGLLVPGITQVTAGWASTNFSRICAQLVQPMSPAHAGSGRARELAQQPAAAERLVDHHRDAVVLREVEQPSLDAAVVERVVHLHEVEAAERSTASSAPCSLSV